MSYLNLNKEKAQAVANELNTLLADYHLYYQKLRNFHWNIVGSYFFELHEKFEEMYNDAQVRIDEIAERVLTLRYTPTSNFSDYLEMAHVKESPSDLEDKEMMKTLLEDHGKLLKQMAKVMDAADKAEDEGTLDLIGGYIADHEKTSWMLDAWTMKKTEKHKVL